MSKRIRFMNTVELNHHGRVWPPMTLEMPFDVSESAAKYFVEVEDERPAEELVVRGELELDAPDKKPRRRVKK
ncbi:MAG: hypothetical protein A2284_13405 [Deltaproteobacteria bacterium RIFOXYA12_FULL_61_11]|nr:MAG: hypothetical protein A2284_13405 [Deltaproteobacteria bacterium RIFOXYA12_FULL_61_11]